LNQNVNDKSEKDKSEKDKSEKTASKRKGLGINQGISPLESPAESKIYATFPIQSSNAFNSEQSNKSEKMIKQINQVNDYRDTIMEEIVLPLRNNSLPNNNEIDFLKNNDLAVIYEKTKKLKSNIIIKFKSIMKNTI